MSECGNGCRTVGVPSSALQLLLRTSQKLYLEGGGERGGRALTLISRALEKSRTMVKLNIENLHKDAVDCLGLGNMNDEIV